MTLTVFLFRLLLIFFIVKETKAGGQMEGPVWSECRDRYLWIQVASAETPRFEAVDQDGVHSISSLLASRCGYTISTFKKDGITTFRASHYSCFTHNQNDELFTFRFNVMVSDGGGRWSSQPVSAACSGLSWTHREVTCEENYMEVNVNRESSCGGQRVEGGQVWQKALFQAQRTAGLSWQLMFLQSDGQTFSMSVPEAQRRGYSLMATTQRVVLRSPYKQVNAEVTMVAGVPVEMVQVSLFFKQKLLVVMIDMSMACTVNSGSFDGTQLIWDIPQVLPTLVGEGAGFGSQSFRLGLEGVLLDEATAATRGLEMVQQEGLVKIGVPFGTEGGYKQSLVEDNVYKEVYKILLMYEHVFSLVYDDGNSIDTKHRILKVLETPLICRPPFSLNKTNSDLQEFNVYLGNVPANVILENIRINGKLMLGRTEEGLSVSPIVHLNGSRAYVLRLPFHDPSVHWTNGGGGVVEYSIDMNFTLTIVPQKDSYYHQTTITAHVFNAFPPEITAQCLDGGISFSVVRPPRSLWEVGVDHEPLTAQLVAQRGYRLHNDSERTTLEVPLFSVGYTYEEINLSNFYATFTLLLRNSKTLEVQASTSKRCLFRTEDMTVCSADGTMTVVATPASTWPTVQPERTSLLDRTCKPKQTNGARVLFEFKLNSCGTKALIGDWYIVYENEILHDRLLIADGPNFISREPQFKVTVRCFYPLSAVNRISLDRIFTSASPGFGSMRVFESHRVTGGALPQLGLGPQPKPGPTHFSGSGQNQLLSSQNQDRSSQAQTRQVSQPSQLPDGRIQWVRLSTSPNFEEEGWKTSEPRENYPTMGPFGRIPGAPVGERLGSSSQLLQHLNKLAEGTSHSGLLRETSKHPLNLYGSSNGGMEKINVVQRPVHQPSFQYQSSEIHQAQPFLEQQDHIRNQLPQPTEHETRFPADSITDWSKLLQESFHNELTTDTSRTVQNLERLGPMERRNVQSRVQNIRVKPPSKFVSSVLLLNQKPVVQQAHHQTSSSSQYVTGLTAASSDGRREDHILKRPGINFTDPAPKWPEHQSEQVQSSAETENRRRDLNSFQRGVPQTTGGGAKDGEQNQASRPKVGSTRTFYQTDISTVNTRIQNLTTGGAEVTGLRTNPEGLIGSELMMQSRLGCTDEPDPYEPSVHRGIIRGGRLG